jgi:uncharacterized protein YjbJ (UPF0337 family)
MGIIITKGVGLMKSIGDKIKEIKERLSAKSKIKAGEAMDDKELELKGRLQKRKISKKEEAEEKKEELKKKVERTEEDAKNKGQEKKDEILEKVNRKLEETEKE